MKIKVIANYLPQYHEIPENNQWWGKGYTDWNAVRDAKPLYIDHIQPKVPAKGHYYSLDNVEELRWQAQLAREYGIYGFGIYHYWFSSDMHLLDKPVFLLRENEDIDIHYCLIWDNTNWNRTWSNVQFSNDWAPLYEKETGEKKTGTGVLAELKYGSEKEWKEHFDYLLQFFEDSRYIKIDNKPVFAVFNQDNKPETLQSMFSCWDALAKEHGFAGVHIIGKTNNKGVSVTKSEMFYNPQWDGWLWHNLYQRTKDKLHREICFKRGIPVCYGYDAVWRRILRSAKKSSPDILLSGFVNYDDTPRRGKKGRIIKHSSPAKFRDYMIKLLRLSREQGKEYVFVTAWNEWGEGAYLEPDERDGLNYLKALSEAVKVTNGND